MEVAVKLEVDDAEDWTYRGEGAVNLVLAYTGSSPHLMGKVLRIQKVATARSGDITALTEEERLVWREEDQMVLCPTRDMVDHHFVSFIMRPLLGPSLVDPGVRVGVSREFLGAVQQKTVALRPAWRIEAANVDTDRDSAILMADHSFFPGGAVAGGPCLSVEIKPKCGFLPSSRFIDDRYAFKRSVARYTMHQLLKLQKQEVSELSQYDPLDLFSGSRERICKAIKDLYATPQNNFRVFLNGSLIFGGLGGGTKKTSPNISGVFEEKLKSVILATNGSRIESFLQLVADTLYSSRVLDQLLKVQRLDNLDIEGVIHVYYNVVSRPCTVCKELAESGLPNRYASLHSLGIDESVKILKDYLIATTAKDCSIMVSYRPTADENHVSPSASSVHLPSTDQRFDYKVHFIDLDLKPLTKMEDYYKLDQKILRCYAQMIEMKLADHKSTN